jgi:hypothetical protein
MVDELRNDIVAFVQANRVVSLAIVRENWQGYLGLQATLLALEHEGRIGRTQGYDLIYDPAYARPDGDTLRVQV